MWLQKNNNEELLKTSILPSLKTIFPDAVEVQSVILKRQNVFSHKRSGICTFSRKRNTGTMTQKIWLKQLNNKFDNYTEMTSFLLTLPEKLKRFFLEYYFYISEENILGMKYIEGTLLPKALLKAVIGLPSSWEFNDIFFKLGEFLKIFQTHHEKGKRKLSSCIEETQEALKRSELLAENSIRKILNHLCMLNESFGHKYVVITKLINDFSLRNILLNRGGEFKILDTESLFNPRFPAYGAEWLDFVNFVLNLRNFSFFLHPPKVIVWRQNFTQGFLGDCLEKDKAYMRACIYVFTVQLLIGMIERPLEQRYSGLRHRFFIQSMKQSVAEGVDLGVL